jgi:hypothetical protein
VPGSILGGGGVSGTVRCEEVKVVMSFHCLTGRTYLAFVDSTHTKGVDLALLAGVRGLIGVETRATVFAFV